MNTNSNNEQYIERIVDKKIEQYLEVCGAICIEGPKWCGKTWTSSFHSASEFLVGDPKNGFSNRKLAELNPSLILQGETPRMIDEWQEVPAIWDAVRAEIDKREKRTTHSYGVINTTSQRCLTLWNRQNCIFKNEHYVLV